MLRPHFAEYHCQELVESSGWVTQIRDILAVWCMFTPPVPAQLSGALGARDSRLPSRGCKGLAIFPFSALPGSHKWRSTLEVTSGPDCRVTVLAVISPAQRTSAYLPDFGEGVLVNSRTQKPSLQISSLRPPWWGSRGGPDPYPLFSPILGPRPGVSFHSVAGVANKVGSPHEPA